MINEPLNLDNGRELLDYNTDRPPLVLPEYGRSIQNMVDYCLTLTDRQERNRCAHTIVQIMSRLRPHNGDETEYQKKLWNHLAAISHYELDVDYPYEIEKISEQSDERECIAYPQQNISKRHYGAIIESLLKKLPEISDQKEREALIRMVANQMKRSLGNWNKDAMTEEKVLDDLARMTDGAASYLPGELHLLSDNEILTDVQQMRPSKKKKKK